MRTAKEILFDNLIQSQVDWIKEDERNLVYVTDAMEQYADQFRKPVVSGELPPSDLPDKCVQQMQCEYPNGTCKECWR